MKIFFFLILSFSLIIPGMPPHAFGGCYLAVPGNTEIGISPAILLKKKEKKGNCSLFFTAWSAASRSWA